MFRSLRADEIEVRVAQFKENNFVQLLLYKDARCDMNILDETVGSLNWKREHTRDNRNCIVSIWDKEKTQWISKEDTGTESNSEAEKGLASDSFKRACFNWGIGRELYTTPDIKIFLKNFNFIDKYTKYEVSHIKVENGKISELKINAIINFGKERKEVFSFPSKINKKSECEKEEKKKEDDEKTEVLEKFEKLDFEKKEKILIFYKVSSFNELSEKQIKHLNKKLEEMNE